MGLLQYISNKWSCRKLGHHWQFDSPTLGGDFIRCDRCHALEEYLPGAHEPKGYDYDAVHELKRKELGL